ncbi:MAG: hypothetical protein QM715_17550 [Nibricoccus sp.]
MSGKFIAPRFTLFLLAFGCISTCAATEPMKFANMAETLSAQWNDRLCSKLQRFQQQCEPKLKKIAYEIPSLSLPHPFMCGGCHLFALSPFQEDIPVLLFLDTILGASRIQILTVDATGPVEPRLAGILWDELHEGFLIQKKTNTSDIFARKFLYELIGNALRDDEVTEWIEPEETLEKEYAKMKSNTRFSTHYVLEFQGEKWTQIELDVDRFQILVRTKDHWGYSRFDRSYAEGIKTYINDLHAIYANDSTES